MLTILFHKVCHRPVQQRQHLFGRSAEFCAFDPEIQDCTDRDHEGNLPFHAWYTAYAPYEDPEIVVTVFVYSGGEGSTVAIPVAQEALHAWFHELRP